MVERRLAWDGGGKRGGRQQLGMGRESADDCGLAVVLFFSLGDKNISLGFFNYSYSLHVCKYVL
jgi:hypothetical protein